MTSNAFAAIAELQQQSLSSTDAYQLDRIDRALDEIVANLHRDGPAAHQRRSAMANAAKVIAKRRAIRTFDSLDRPTLSGSPLDAGELDPGFDEVDFYQWLDTTTSVRSSEQCLLRSLADGADAEVLARRYCLPTARMRERLSRARGAGRAAYRHEVA